MSSPRERRAPSHGDGAKPRLLIALPGLNYSAVTSHVIPLRRWAGALEDYFDVTLLFRSFVEPPPEGLRCQAVLSAPDHPPELVTTARTFWLGRSLPEEWRYLAHLRRLMRRTVGEFDLVIEKQWRYMGLIAAMGRENGVPSGFLSEGEFYLTGDEAELSLKRRAGLVLRRRLMRHVRRRGVARADFIICETDELAAIMTRAHGPDCAGRINVIPPGIDPEQFFPRDRGACRAQLGWDTDKTVLVYLGALNGSIQCPGRVLEGLAQAGPDRFALHVVGAGDKRAALEARARALGLEATFHGYKPQSEAALFVGAADLCLAPYRQNAYRGGIFTSGSCKAQEYIASGRLVVTIPASRMAFVTKGGRYGYLVDDTAEAYARFFSALPAQAERRDKEQALLADLAGDVPVREGRILRWSDNAQRYWRALSPLLAAPEVAQ